MIDVNATKHYSTKHLSDKSDMSEWYALAQMEIGNRRAVARYVRASRRSADLSQKDLADRAKTSRETIVRIEGGDETVKPSTLLDVIAALDAVGPFTRHSITARPKELTSRRCGMRSGDAPPTSTTTTSTSVRCYGFGFSR